MAEMIPVGNTGTPPNAGQTLSNLSSIYGIQSQQLGIQQQRQALQTGQYQQATAQAQSQQEQQKNQELQALHSFTANAIHDPKYQLPDGTPDTNKFTQGAMAVAGTYGQPFIGQAASTFAEGAQTRRTLQGLSADQNKTLSDGLKGLANIPGGATRSDVLNWVEQIESNNKDPALHRSLNNLIISMTPDQEGGYSGSAAKAAATLGGLSMQEPGQINVAGGTQPVTTTTLGPNVGQVTKQGPIVKNIVGPTQEIPYRAAAAAAESGASARATGVSKTDVDRQDLISNSIRPSMAGIGLTQQIDGLADIVHTGKISAEFSKAAAALGVSDATSARQLLEKDLGQLKSQATSNAPSNDARDTILSGYPSAETDTDVIHAAMDYIRGSFKQNLARGELLQTYRKHRPDLTGLASADDALTSRFDPKMTEFMSLKTPQERTEFYKRNFHSAEEAHAFKNQMSGGQNGQ